MSFPFMLRRCGWVLALLVQLASCGGVDSGGTGTGAASTFAAGPVTGFGSILVNGVHYDEADARIEIEDDEGSRLPADLKLGMQVEVHAGSITDSAGVARAAAQAIHLRSAIVGPLESFDAALARLTVLGQTVRIVATTVFDATLEGGAAALNRGDVLEVYATLDAVSGQYVASRIERRDGAASYKLRGNVGSLSLAEQTLTVGALTIDWSAVAPADPATTLQPGRYLRIDLDPVPVAGRWRARALRAGAAVPDDHEFAEVEGRITAFESPLHFVVNGIAVDATTARVPASGLALGAQVEVQGSLRAGVLVAVSVEPRSADGGADLFEIEGAIDAVDAATQTFTVRGVTVEWSASTQFDSSAPTDLRVGRRVAVKGALSSEGTRLRAALIHVEV